jgi:hypothetical protein
VKEEIDEKLHRLFASRPGRGVVRSRNAVGCPALVAKHLSLATKVSCHSLEEMSREAHKKDEGDRCVNLGTTRLSHEDPGYE